MMFKCVVMVIKWWICCESSAWGLYSKVVLHIWQLPKKCFVIIFVKFEIDKTNRTKATYCYYILLISAFPRLTQVVLIIVSSCYPSIASGQLHAIDWYLSYHLPPGWYHPIYFLYLSCYQKVSDQRKMNTSSQCASASDLQSHQHNKVTNYQDFGFFFFSFYLKRCQWQLAPCVQGKIFMTGKQTYRFSVIFNLGGKKNLTTKPTKGGNSA